MKYLLYSAILGFTFWLTSEVLEIVQRGYSPPVYYLTAAYHFFAGLGIWGLHKKQTPNKNTFNTVSAAIAAIAYIAFTIFPLQVMNAGLSFSAFVNANPLYKFVGFIWFVGMVLFSISVIRTSFFPLWSGMVMLVGTMIFTATPLLGWPVLLVNTTNIIFAATVIYVSFTSLRQTPSNAKAVSNS